MAYPIGVMIRHLAHMDAIPDEEAKKLWIGRSRRGWQETGPLDDEIPFERPRLLSESILLLVEEQVLSKSEILSSLRFSERDIERLGGLNQGYLTDSMPVIKIIPGRRHSPRPSAPAPVVAFPPPERKTEARKRKAN